MINIENNRLVWKTSGETVVIEPWGENALRIRSVMMGDILETDYALLPQRNPDCVIKAGKDQASITNGKLTAQIVLAASGWRKDHGRFTDRMGEYYLAILTMRILPVRTREGFCQGAEGLRA